MYDLNRECNRVVFDSWPSGAGPDHPITSVDGGYMPGLEAEIYVAY